MSNNNNDTIDIEPTEEQLATEQHYYSHLQFKADESTLKEKGISRGSILMDVVKQLRTGADLFRISLPSALLAPISMLEYISYFIRPQSYILSAHKAFDPEQRFVSVLKWWLSNTSHTPRGGIMQAKPYNPVIGEVFACKWIHKDPSSGEISKTEFITEQVSHHPPMASGVLLNRKSNLLLNAMIKPKSKFHGNSASIVLDGSITMRFLNQPESEIYDIVFPWVVAKGLIWGTQCIEINEDLKITCAGTGYSAKIQFKADNEIKGSIKKDGNRIYKVRGNITGEVRIRSVKTKKESVFFDAKDLEHAPWFVKKVANQKSNESRRVWHKVTKALADGEFEEANVQKNLIEEKQRGLRKKREESGQAWKQDLFKLKEGTEDEYLFKYDLNSEEYKSKSLGDFIDFLKEDEEEIEFAKKL
nr:unnamed protein product [Naegleria fowleri]